MVALGRSWHPEEFTCCQCRAVLDEGGFFEEKGSVYCTKCYDNRYAPNCAKCKKKIAGVSIVLLQVFKIRSQISSWHALKEQRTSKEGHIKFIKSHL